MDAPNTTPGGLKEAIAIFALIVWTLGEVIVMVLLGLGAWT